MDDVASISEGGWPMRRATIVAVSMFACLALGSAPALAAKHHHHHHHGTTASSITLNQAKAYLGENVTFSTAYPNTVKNPRIQIMCYQNSAMTYAAADGASATFLLGGAASQWRTNGGPASCQADLYYWSVVNNQEVFNLLSSMTFNAAGGP
jgi:hypothetical protein